MIDIMESYKKSYIEKIDKYFCSIEDSRKKNKINSKNRVNISNIEEQR